MSKIHITKEQLINELNMLQDSVTKKQIVAPMGFLVLITGFMLTLLLAIPIVIAWLFLILLYIPLYFIDLFIARLVTRRKKDV
jgi:hypothetical protein